MPHGLPLARGERELVEIGKIVVVLAAPKHVHAVVVHVACVAVAAGRRGPGRGDGMPCQRVEVQHEELVKAVLIVAASEHIHVVAEHNRCVVEPLRQLAL